MCRLSGMRPNNLPSQTYRETGGYVRCMKVLTILQLPREGEAGGKRAQRRKGLVITRRSTGQGSGKFRELVLEPCLREWVGLSQAGKSERAFEAADIIQRRDNSLFIWGKWTNLACWLHRELSWGRVEGNELENQSGSGKMDFICLHHLPTTSHTMLLKVILLQLNPASIYSLKSHVPGWPFHPLE